jgi:hypothetical protein
MEEIIQKWIKTSIDNNKNVFQFICEKIDELKNIPATNIGDLKNKNTKLIGDYFEVFITIYLKYLNYQVYLLKDVPNELLLNLKLERKDMGIDIIAEKDGEYYAVQCKYKSNKNKKYTAVSWKELSTFYSLCMRSGPWKKLIVCTSASFIRIQGDKKETDLLLTKTLFENIDLVDWKNICNYKTIFELSKGNKLNNTENNLINNLINNSINNSINNDMENKLINYSINNSINNNMENNSINNDMEELRNKRVQHFKNIGVIK